MARRWIDLSVTDIQEDWRHYWLTESFWHILFFVIQLSIAWLWRPTNNNARYACVWLTHVLLLCRCAV